MSKKNWKMSFLEKPLILLLTDEKMMKYAFDYKYSLDWQKARKISAIMEMKKYIFDGITESVQRETEQAEERGVFTLEELEYMDDIIRSLFMRGEEAQLNKSVVMKIRKLIEKDKDE